MLTTVTQTLRLHAEGRLDTPTAQRILDDMLTNLECRRREIAEQQRVAANALIALDVRQVRKVHAGGDAAH